MNKLQARDGAQIAFEVAGDGPPLILIGGAFCDRRARASGTPLAAALAKQLRVYSYDRRGRGDSSDVLPWSIEREVEDLQALIAHAGGNASLYGISSGAFLALHTALHAQVDKLVLYDAPLQLDVGPQFEAIADELAALTSANKRSEAAALFLTRIVGMPAPAVAGMQHAPHWPGLTALAHTLSYDVRITADAPRLLARGAAIAAPTLALCGGASPPWMHEASRTLASAVAHGQARVLEGQAHDVDPAQLAAALLQFLA